MCYFLDNVAPDNNQDFGKQKLGIVIKQDDISMRFRK